ncbi:hypothetical protein MHYP_G00342110 [Metynnis hypsauchen]
MIMQVSDQTNIPKNLLAKCEAAAASINSQHTMQPQPVSLTPQTIGGCSGMHWSHSGGGAEHGVNPNRGSVTPPVNAMAPQGKTQ